MILVLSLAQVCIAFLAPSGVVRAVSRARQLSGRLSIDTRADYAATDLYLGVDCGTQGTKVVVYDADSKRLLGVGAVSYGLNPSSTVGEAEQHPSDWVEAMFEAAAEALAQATLALDGRAAGDRVRGIGVSGQQHGLVALDRDHNVIRPCKLWCDTTSSAEAQELAQRLGWGIVASFTSTKLLWLKHNEPLNFAKLEHIALPHDYLNYVLTGTLVMEAGDASGTGLLDTSTRTWDASAADMIDPSLLSKLPPLLSKPSGAAGTLRNEVACRLGVPAGTPVSAGGGDNMMSA